MQHRVVECECGQRMQVPDSALGKTGTCVGCGVRLTITLQNSHPGASEWAPPTPPANNPSSNDDGPLENPFGTASDASFVPRRSGREAPETLRSAADCRTRCGRAFRGEWDREETGEGELCHLCANLATDETAYPPQRLNQKEPRPLRIPGPQLPDPEPAKRQFGKGPYILLACAVITIIILCCVMPVEYWMADFFTGQADTEAVSNATWWRITYPLMSLGQVFLGMFLPICLVLYWNGRWPHENALMNCFSIGGFCLLMLTLSLACFAPLIGIIMAGFLTVTYLGLLYAWYDFHMEDYCALFVATLLVNPFLFGVKFLVGGRPRRGIFVIVACGANAVRRSLFPLRYRYRYRHRY